MQDLTPSFNAEHPSAIAYRDAVRLEYDKAASDLPFFVHRAWDVLEPHTKLLWNWHHSLLCEYLDAIKSGEITRLIFNVAPRSTKSLITTVSFPSWWWTTEAHRKFLFGSFSQPLATKHSVLRRNLIQSDWYQEGYGEEVEITSDTNMKTEFVNTATGLMRAAGINSGITGEGADCIVIDDPHNPQGADRELPRETALQNFDLGWTTRLNDKKTGRIIIVMQRLHQADLTGHVMKEMGYEHVILPSICEKKTIVVFPLSKREIIREEGDLLHPEREGKEELEKAKKDMGSYGFAGQHQQNPVPREGAIIKIAWLKFYKEIPARFDRIIQSWDCAFKGTETSDPVCGLIWGRVKGEFYLLPERFYGQVDMPGTIAAVRALTARRPEVLSKRVEAKANGQAVIDTLKKEIPGLQGFDPGPYGSKEERLSAVSPLFESGNIYLPDASIAPWIGDYIDELTTFPKSVHKDQVDATSQALLILNDRKNIDWSLVSITGASKWKL